MVMEAPSPQLVGQEFVRQYYTLLHEGPKYLHRFYSNNSSYIHGGIVEAGGISQEPAVGQSEIHKKIMALNFSECHTKIRLVDSQATVGNGVVVQVTGELSNNGSPMRRFMQTFVLAPQSANKYYVHNDIFRYQDEVFCDDSDSADDDATVASAHEVAGIEKLAEESSIELQHQHQHQPPAVHHEAALLAPTNQYNKQQEQRSGAQHILPTDASNGQLELRPTEVTANDGRKLDEPVPLPAVATEPDRRQAERTRPQQQRTYDLPAAPSAATNETAVSAGADKVPRSWSVIASKQSGPSAAAAKHHHEPAKQEAQTPAQATAATGQLPGPQAAGRPPGKEQEAAAASVVTADKQSPQQLDGPLGQAVRVSPTPVTEERRRYLDNQQVFVGNLPQGITDEQLKEFFSKFGEVLEVRLNNANAAASMKSPYAFVIFREINAVQLILSGEALEYNGHRINVEEKKPRNRFPYNPNNSYRPQPGNRFRAPNVNHRGGFGSAPPQRRQQQQS